MPAAALDGSTRSAAKVNGRTSWVSGDVVALFTDPVPERRIERAGGWDLDALDQAAPEELVAGLVNRYALDHPALQVFDG